jgi:nucleotide-binding universal stress UspA family protein
MAVNDVVEDGAVNILSQPILVPLDGTDVASGILPYVSQIAERANVPLVLLTAVDPDAIDYPASAMSAVPASAGESMVIYRTQFEESSRVHAQDALHRVAARLRDDGVEAKSIATIGSPAEEILRVSEEEGCGLIAMSTHGRNPIGRSILGSVTDRVIHASQHSGAGRDSGEGEEVPGGGGTPNHHRCAP